MRTVVSEAERLERLVSDLLDFARPKEPQIGEFDFAALVSEVQSLLQQRLDSAGITLELSLAVGTRRIRSDAGGLRQILLNVLFNALDATPRGGLVTLRAGLKDHDRFLEVEIEDTGQGLGNRNPEELFQPFVTTKVRGTGLGLAVSRQIAESLGASLSLANRPQGGARCVIRLPLQPG
jgi:two-component system sensor histidine kinase HydH